jgi:hypothetical protein
VTKATTAPTAEQRWMVMGMADIHSELMGLLARVPYVRCEDVHRQYAVNWLMNNGVTVPVRCKDCWKSADGLCSYKFKNAPGKDFCGDGERRTQ